MARQDIAILDISPFKEQDGSVFQAAVADGNFLRNNEGRVLLRVENRSGSLQTTVTIRVPQTIDGQQVQDLTFLMDTSDTAFFGPFPPKTYNQRGSDGNVVHIDYSQVVDVFVQAIGY